VSESSRPYVIGERGFRWVTSTFFPPLYEEGDQRSWRVGPADSSNPTRPWLRQGHPPHKGEGSALSRPAKIPLA